MQTYKKKSARYKVCMEWGIGALKWKWKRLMDHFDFTKENYNHFFQIVTIFINFLHTCQLDFTFKVIGTQTEHLIDYGWDGDFQLEV
jgi:hypothetical protein